MGIGLELFERGVPVAVREAVRPPAEKATSKVIQTGAPTLEDLSGFARNVFQEQHPDLTNAQRRKIQNLTHGDPTVAIRNLEKMGFQVRQVGDFDFAIRKPGTAWYKVDPGRGHGGGTEEFKDLTDIGGGILTGVAQGVGAFLGGVGGAATGPAAPAAIPLGATAGSSVLSGAAEALLGGIGRASGLDISAEETYEGAKREALLGGLSEIGGRAIVGGAKLAGKGIRALRGRAATPPVTEAIPRGGAGVTEPFTPSQPVISEPLVPDVSPRRAALEALAGDEPRMVPDIPEVTPEIPGEPVVPAPSVISEPILPPEPAPRTVAATPSYFGSMTREEAEEAARSLQGQVAGPARVRDIGVLKDEGGGLALQFKQGANALGEVEPLKGRFDPAKAGAIVTWVRNDGTEWVIEGHHRLAHAARSGQGWINRIALREADGITLGKAREIGAMANISAGNGSLSDYVRFFSESGIPEDIARSEGLLARVKGKDAWILARHGSDSTKASVLGGHIPESAGVAVADWGRGNDSLQQALLKYVLRKNGHVDYQQIGDYAQVLKSAGKGAAPSGFEQGDILTTILGKAGSEDFNRIAEQQMEIADAIRAEIQSEITAVEPALNRLEIAIKAGLARPLDQAEAAALAERVMVLKGQRAAWKNWGEHPDLIKEVERRSGRGIGGESPIAPTLTGQTPPPSAAPPPEAPGQGDLFGGPAAPPPEPPPPPVEPIEPAMDPAKIDAELARLQTKLNGGKEWMGKTEPTRVLGLKEKLTRARNAKIRENEGPVAKKTRLDKIAKLEKEVAETEARISSLKKLAGEGEAPPSGPQTGPQSPSPADLHRAAGKALWEGTRQSPEEAAEHAAMSDAVWQYRAENVEQALADTPRATKKPDVVTYARSEVEKILGEFRDPDDLVTVIYFAEGKAGGPPRLQRVTGLTRFEKLPDGRLVSFGHVKPEDLALQGKAWDDFISKWSDQDVLDTAKTMGWNPAQGELEAVGRTPIDSAKTFLKKQQAFYTSGAATEGKVSKAFVSAHAGEIGKNIADTGSFRMSSKPGYSTAEHLQGRAGWTTIKFDRVTDIVLADRRHFVFKNGTPQLLQLDLTPYYSPGTVLRTHEEAETTKANLLNSSPDRRAILTKIVSSSHEEGIGETLPGRGEIPPDGLGRMPGEISTNERLAGPPVSQPEYAGRLDKLLKEDPDSWPSSQWAREGRNVEKPGTLGEETGLPGPREGGPIGPGTYRGTTGGPGGGEGALGPERLGDQDWFAWSGPEAYAGLGAAPVAPSAPGAPRALSATQRALGKVVGGLGRGLMRAAGRAPAVDPSQVGVKAALSGALTLASGGHLGMAAVSALRGAGRQIFRRGRWGWIGAGLGGMTTGTGLGALGGAAVGLGAQTATSAMGRALNAIGTGLERDAGATIWALMRANPPPTIAKVLSHSLNAQLQGRSPASHSALLFALSQDSSFRSWVESWE